MYHSSLFSGTIPNETNLRNPGMEPETWPVLADPLFWLLTAASLATAAAPALPRPVGKRKAIAIAALWATISGISVTLFGVLPALASALFSLLSGALLLAASLVFSGIRSMPNRRYEERKP